MPGRLHKTFIASALVFILLLLLFFAGCSQPPNRLNSQVLKARTVIVDTPGNLTPEAQAAQPGTNPGQTPTPGSSDPTGIQVGDLEGTRIRFWHPWNGQTGGVISSLVDRFNSENEWGIQVDAEYKGNLDDISGQVQASIAEGQPPDIAVGYLYQLLDWSTEWDLVDLGTYFNDPGVGFSPQEQSAMFPPFWDHDKVDGERIALPALRYGQLLYYNASWAEELGFSSAPVSPQEFTQQACAAASANLSDEDPDNDGTGGWIISTHYSTILSWLYAFGADVALPGDPALPEGGYLFDTPEVASSLAFLRELYDAGCAWLPEVEYLEGDFALRRGLFAPGSVASIPYQRSAMLQAGNADQWEVIPFPGDSAGALNVYGPSYSILTSTGEQELASWLFTRWLLQPENQVPLVEATSAFPLSSGILDQLEGSDILHPQWYQAAGLLSSAISEPPFQSWFLVRWALSDAATQLFRYYFTLEQLPATLAFLDQTANDLHQGPLYDSSLELSDQAVSPDADSTGTMTPVPETTPTPTP